MFHQIDFNDKIFNSSEYQKDIISFNLIPHFIKNKEKFPDIKCYSDNENVILLNTDENHPVITWTSEKFNDYTNLYNFLKKTFHKNNPLHIMSKKCLYDFYQGNHLILNDATTDIAGIYKCSKLNKVKTDGYLDFAKPDEQELIAKMLQQFNQEAQPNEKRPFSYYLTEAENFVKNTETHKVWKNSNNQITSVGRLEIVNQHARIGRIFTLPEYRGHSYAKMLVQELATIAFKRDLIPVLYTNFKYEPSNRCYQAIGFELLNTIFIYELLKS